MSTYIYNELIMIMFRPTLKRAKLTDPYLENSSTSRYLQSDIEMDKLLYLESAKTPDLYIPSLLTKHNANASHGEQRIITPLKCWDLAYPAEVKQKLGLPVTQVKSRLVGSKFGVYWLITENELYLWRYQSIENPTTLSQHRKYEFESNLRAIDVGHLDPNFCSLVNMTEHHETIALGFQRIIDMYTIDMRTLELKSMDIRFKVEFGEILETVLITSNNQIYYTGDQGYLTRVSFNSSDSYGTPKITKSNARPPLLNAKSIWSSLKMTAKQDRVFTEKILPTNGNKIYVLVKKQNQSSVFQKLKLSLVKFLSGKIRSSEQNSGIEKEIHVYSIENSKQGTIKFKGIIKNSEIEQKIKECYSANQNVSERLKNIPIIFNPANTISNIFIKAESETNRLSVATNYGIFLTIRDEFDGSNQNSNPATFSFEDTPSALPAQLFQRNKRSSSIAMILSPKSSINYRNVKGDQDADEFEPLADKQSFFICAFGNSNLNVLNSGLCFYFDSNEIQIAKLDKFPGFIMESASKKSFLPMDDMKTWLVFSKTEVTVLRRSELYEHVITTLSTINDLQRVGIENGQRSQRYEFYANFAISEIIKLVGNARFSRSLYAILLKIIQSKLSNASPQMKRFAVAISNEAKDVLKQEQKFKIRLLNRLKYQNLINEPTNNLFTRWLLPKRKQVQLINIPISEEMEMVLWRYFLVSNLESDSQVAKYGSRQKSSQKLSPFSAISIQLFKMCYNSIKNLTITEIRQSPQKIKEVKGYLLSILGLLEERKLKSMTLSHSLAYVQPRSYMDKKPDLNTSTQDTININLNQSMNVSSIFAPGARSPRVNQATQSAETVIVPSSSTQEILNQICRVIPKVMNTIQLYEFIASSTQGRHEKLPSIQKFFQSFSARKQVKAALLDLFCMTQIWKNAMILKVSKAFPEINLEADIYVAKWLSFVHRAERDKQFDTKASIAGQIRISNIEQLTKKIEIEQLLKIKELFKGNSEIYSLILVNQLKMRKNQLRISKQMMKNKIKQGQLNTLNNDSLIFEEDRQRANLQSRVWLESEVVSIRNQIKAYLQQLCFKVSKSPPAQYLQEDQQLDSATKLIRQRSEEGEQFIQDLIAFLQSSNLIPEKLYQLSTLVNSTSKTSLLSSLLQNSKPELMSSSSFVNNFIKSNKHVDIFGAQERPVAFAAEGKVENGESTISI